jgi:hypothetical protein
MSEINSVSIGKALLERSAVNAKIKDIITRITNNSVTSLKSNGEKESTIENIETLIENLGHLEKRHEIISKALINANYSTIVKLENAEWRLIDVIEKIDNFTKKLKYLKELITHIETNTVKKSKTLYDFNNDEARNVSNIDITELRKKCEKISHDKNKWQVALQEANWSTQISY